MGDIKYMEYIVHIIGFQYRILCLLCLFSALCEGGCPFEFTSIPSPHSCAFHPVPWPGGTRVTVAHHSELPGNTPGPPSEHVLPS